MSSWENKGGPVEYYTPEYVLNAFGCKFDMDVASPVDRTFCHVPAQEFITENSLEKQWNGFIWMNPPFLNEKDKIKWLIKFYSHGDGIALMPDRSSAGWWQMAAQKCDLMLMVHGKIKFIRENGEMATSPSTGTTLFAIGNKGINAIIKASNNGLGIILRK